MSNRQPTRAMHGLVTLVLPAKNEEAALGRTLRALPLATLNAMGFATEVVVLDGHSRDRTAQIALDFGARVVPDREPGKGSAFRHALEKLRGDYVVMLDADGTYAPDAIPRAVNRLAWGMADVVMGDRLPLPGSMSSVHLLGNTALSVIASVLYGTKCRDLCTGFWGFRIDALRALPLRSRGFGLEAELFAFVTRMRLRVEHINVDYLPRQGVAKLSFGHDGLRILRRLMRSRLAPIARPQRAKPGSPRHAPSSEVRA